LGQAFGIGTQTGQGGIQFGGDIPEITSGQLFGPAQFEGLGDIFDPIQSPFEFNLGGLGTAAESGFGTLSEAAETGLIDPATELSRQLFGDFIADTQEQLGSQLGLGTGDSDFAAILAREAQRSSTELANLAQDRRLAASQALPSAAGALSSLEEAFRGVERGRDPSQQILNTLLNLGGLNLQGQSVGQQSNRTRSSGAQGGLK
jgi:hypothetical protein